MAIYQNDRSRGGDAVRTRRGVSLVEILIVMSAITVVISLSGKIMHQMMHAHSRAQRMMQGERTALRLSAQLRRDVHRAEEVQIAGEVPQQTITLRGPELGEVQYRAEGETVLRSGGKPGAMAARESFVFPGRIHVAWEQLAGPARLRVQVQPPIDDKGRPDARSSREVPSFATIEACLARKAVPLQSATPEEQTP
jgi:hypothetical protein